MYADIANTRHPSWPMAFLWALLLHVAVYCVFFFAFDIFRSKPEEVIPIDMTIVPPDAKQTDDPDVDPNPPPPPQPEVKPQPKPIEPPKVEEKLDAVEQEHKKEKEKPKPPPKPKDLRELAQLVKTPPKVTPPPDLRAQANKIVPPPSTYGKGTAHDKPLSPEEIKKLLDQGYTYGSRNQLASSEEQRCASMVMQAIRREWDKESFRWFDGLKPIEVEISLAVGGRVTGFRILSSSGDGEVDRTARSALARLKSIPGLSAGYIESHPNLAISMVPKQQ